MKSNKEWFSAAELAGLSGMPAHATNVTRKAKSSDWSFRQVEGKKGVSYEYHFSSLPLVTQEAIYQQEPNLEVGGEFTSNHPKVAADINVEVLTNIIEAVELLIANKRHTVSLNKKAQVIAHLYRVCIQEDKIDPRLIKQTLELVS